MSNENVITNERGQLRSAVGPDAVKAFGLRTLIQALDFEQRTGMKASRVSSIATAKRVTGLKTNNRAKQIEALTKLFNEQIAKCEIVGY